jgi:small-conductance mechanosensitive channel
MRLCIALMAGAMPMVLRPTGTAGRGWRTISTSSTAMSRRELTLHQPRRSILSAVLWFVGAFVVAHVVQLLLNPAPAAPPPVAARWHRDGCHDRG